MLQYIPLRSFVEHEAIHTLQNRCFADRSVSRRNMIDAMSVVASVAPLSVQDQRRERIRSRWRVPSPSRLSLNLSRSRFARAPAESQLSLSLSLSRYSGRTIVRRRLNKESPRLRLQPRIRTHYTNNVMSKSEVLTPNDRERASSIKIEIGKMFYMLLRFISFAIFEILYACFGSDAFYRDYSREMKFVWK